MSVRYPDDGRYLDPQELQLQRAYVRRLQDEAEARDAEIKKLRRKIRQQKTAINGQHDSIRKLKQEIKECKPKTTPAK